MLIKSPCLAVFTVVGGGSSIRLGQQHRIPSADERTRTRPRKSSLAVGMNDDDTRTTLATPDRTESVILACASGIKATFAIAFGLVGFATLRSFINPRRRPRGQGNMKTSTSRE